MSGLSWRENHVEEENRNKLARAEEEYQQQLSRLIAFENDGTHWSGIGERLDVNEEHIEETFRRELAQGEELSSGTYGTVRKVIYRKVALAVKEMKLRWLSAYQIEQLKQEAFIGQRLDSHKHVIKHVGTYYQGQNTADCRLSILTFPVAICDLGQFLDECEEFIQPRRDRLHELMTIGQRLVALGFHVSKPKAELRVEIQSRLHEILGCLTEAIEWMHSNNVRHRDLKPANILLRPGQVLLTDFGISRHRIVGESTSTETDFGFTWGYAAPEVLGTDGIGSLAKADVYSLGCVFLHLLTVTYGPNVDLGKISSNLQQPRGRHHLREKLFRAYLDSIPDHTKQTAPAHPFIPPVFTKILAGMLHPKNDCRPSISEVNATLRALCIEDEWLYGPCCHRIATSTENPKMKLPERLVYLPKNGDPGRAENRAGSGPEEVLKNQIKAAVNTAMPDGERTAQNSLSSSEDSHVSPPIPGRQSFRKQTDLHHEGAEYRRPGASTSAGYANSYTAEPRDVNTRRGRSPGPNSATTYTANGRLRHSKRNREPSPPRRNYTYYLRKDIGGPESTLQRPNDTDLASSSSKAIKSAAPDRKRSSNSRTKLPPILAWTAGGSYESIGQTSTSSKKTQRSVTERR